MSKVSKVFVSGCFDVLHGGHVHFLRQAKSLGDWLTVSVASDEALMRHKGRPPAMPAEHKAHVLAALDCVDEVVISSCHPTEPGLDFAEAFKARRPDILAVTEDDRYAQAKRDLCAEFGARYVVLPKGLEYPKISVSEIRRRIRGWVTIPMRVDFAGGWLDVPDLAQCGAFVVNCAVRPGIDERAWPHGSGLGGSAAAAMRDGINGIHAEIEQGVGWQDAAVIRETGLCVWRSGLMPSLETKTPGSWLRGLMAIEWTGQRHVTAGLTRRDRDYGTIRRAGDVAREAVIREDLKRLSQAVVLSHRAQIAEGMDPLRPSIRELACKYCGAGWGGYGLYLFAHPEDRDEFVASSPEAVAIEPYERWSDLWQQASIPAAQPA